MISLPERETEMLECFLPLPDLRERLELVMDWGMAACGTLADEERIDVHRVDGCVSRIWLLHAISPEGRPVFRVDADSTLVKGLAGAHLRFYEGATAAQIVEYPPAFLDKLGFRKILSATRQRGFEAFYQRLSNLAISGASGG